MAADAKAAGLWSLGRGAGLFARGGANIAAPQDPTALYLNPAALAGLDGLQVYLDGNWIVDHRTFTRAPDCTVDEEIVAASGCPAESLNVYDTASHSLVPAMPSPGVFAAYNFASLGIETLTVAAGVFGPPRSDRVWPADGAQRYGEVETHNLQVQYALGLGYELPWYGIRVGATGMFISQILRTQLRLNTFFSFPENAAYDAHIDASVHEDWILNAAFGISGRPIEPVTVALAYRLPYDVHASGTVGVEFQHGIGSLAVVTGDRLDILLHMPAAFRAALLYRHPHEAFDVELAFQWEQWSRYDEVTLRPKGIEVDIEGRPEPLVLEDISIAIKARDSSSLRFGGEYRLLPDRLTVRAGGYYEWAAIGDRQLNADFFDLDKIGFTLGGRVDLPLRDWFNLPFGLWIDAAGGYTLWRTKEVTASKRRIINPLATPPEERWPVGNGTYKNRVIMLQAALGAQIDI